MLFAAMAGVVTVTGLNNYTEDQLDTALLAIEKDFSVDTVMYRNNPFRQLGDTIDYMAVEQIWIKTNGAKPYAFVLPQSYEEVSIAIKHLASQGIKPRTQGGGHTYSGDSVQEDNGVTISTNYLRNITIDKENMTVTCQAGLRLGQVYKAVKEAGFIFIAGTHYTTGLSGFTLGGGQSSRSRMYGLAIDQVLSYKMVNAEGKLLEITRDNEYADLFWALQGAGNHNFGIVVEYTFNIYKHEGHETHGHLDFNIKAKDIPKIAKLFTEYVNHHKVLDNRMSMRLDYVNDFNSYENKVSLNYNFFGRKTDCTKVLQKFLKTLPKDYYNEKQIVAKEMNYWKLPGEVDTAPQWPSLGQIYNPTRNAAGSVYMSRVTEEVAKYVVEFFAVGNNTACSPQGRHFQFTPVGGAIKNVAKTDSAFWAREAEVELEFFIPYVNSPLYPNQNPKCRGDMNRFLAGLEKMNETTPGVFLGSYINHVSSDYDDYGKRFWGGNFERLQTIKAKYDPENYFKWQYSVPVGNYTPPVNYTSSAAPIITSSIVAPITTATFTTIQPVVTSVSVDSFSGTKPGEACSKSVGTVVATIAVLSFYLF
eukprot:Pgem_evm1s16655